MTYKKFLSLAKAKNISNIQITEKTEEYSQIELINNKLEDYSDICKISYDIKAEYNGKTVKTTTEYLDASIIDLLIMKANATDSKYQDKYLDKKVIKNTRQKVSIDITNEIKTLKDLYGFAKVHKSISNFDVFYCQSYEQTRIINSKGLDICTDSYNYLFYVSASATKEDKIVSYNSSVLKTDKKNIDFETLTKNVIEKVLKLLDQEKLKTDRYNIVLSSSVADSIISNISNMLSGRSNRMKLSCLSNKLNEKIFSDKLTIIEEPLSKKLPGYSIFDDEGTETYNKTLIENGKIIQYLYNNSEAELANTTSTANEYHNITTRNMYVKPGDKPLELLLKELNNGLYIVDYMGSQGTAINKSTGNISIQVFGFIVKDGKLFHGFEPVVMSTTFEELLSNIEAIGNDLEFYSKNSGSPSLYIKDISIAAE